MNHLTISPFLFNGMSTNFSPQEQQGVFIFGGNSRSIIPVKAQANISNSASVNMEVDENNNNQPKKVTTRKSKIPVPMSVKRTHSEADNDTEIAALCAEFNSKLPKPSTDEPSAKRAKTDNDTEIAAELKEKKPVKVKNVKKVKNTKYRTLVNPLNKQRNRTFVNAFGRTTDIQTMPAVADRVIAPAMVKKPSLPFTKPVIAFGSVVDPNSISESNMSKSMTSKQLRQSIKPLKPETLKHPQTEKARFGTSSDLTPISLKGMTIGEANAKLSENSRRPVNF